MTYHYEAYNRQGEHYQGEIEAGSRQEAAHKIRRQGLWITALTSNDKNTKGIQEYFRETQIFAKAVDDTQIALFFRQMSVLLSAGIPVHEALKSLLAGGRQGSAGRWQAGKLYPLAHRALSTGTQREIFVGSNGGESLFFTADSPVGICW